MKRGITLILACLLLIAVPAMHVFACTIVAVGKNATVDGSTIITHNDDSGSADFRLWIIPAKDWEEGEARDIVLDCHNYGDYGINGDPWENPDYGKGIKMGEDPYTGHTYAYFHCRYSFMNEVGVAMGEATNGLSRRTEKGLAAYNALFADNKGWIDCWNAQDIALERAKTAREAIEVMGYLCETYGWRDPCETMDVTDGNEVWVFEAYGKDMWCAVRIPDDHFFIAANSERIKYIDFNDKAHENYMWCENMVPFAIANGLWKEGDDLAKFSPADIFCPSGSNLRVWRGLCLAAPSMADQFAPTANAATELPQSSPTSSCPSRTSSRSRATTIREQSMTSPCILRQVRSETPTHTPRSVQSASRRAAMSISDRSRHGCLRRSEESAGSVMAEQTRLT